MEGEGQTQRREANALTSHRAPRNVRASLGEGGNGHVSREGRSGNKNIVRVGGDSSKLHPEITATPRTGAGWRGRPRGYVGPMATPRTKRGGGAQAAGASRHPPPRPTPPPPHPQHPNEAPRNGKIRAPCVIRGVSAAKRGPPWQDLRAMHSRKAICGAFRIHGAHILPNPARSGCTAAMCCQGGALFPSGAPSGMHEARILPRMAARERTTAKTCHSQAPGNAPWRHGAGKHRANETSTNSTTCGGASNKP